MWELIVSVPDHCISFYFPFCLTVFVDVLYHFITEGLEYVLVLDGRRPTHAKQSK